MELNWKLVTAFAAGAVLASGIVYLAVKPDMARQDLPTHSAAPLTQPAQRIAAAPPASVIEAPPTPPSIRVPVREKPSPMPPPVRRQKEEVVVRSSPPPSPAPMVPPPVELKPGPPKVVPPPPVQVEKVPVQNVSLPPPSLPPPAVGAHISPTVTLAAGTTLAVRIGETLSSARNQVGDTFLATLTQPLVINVWVIAERGARVEGRIVDATQGGRLRGVPHLEVSIVRVTLSDGQTIRVRTEPYGRDGDSPGGIIGALAGRKPAEIPVETRLTFHVLDALTITERVN